MRIKLVQIVAVAFTLVTIGYMSIAAEAPAKTEAVGGAGVLVGEKDKPAATSESQDQISGGGAMPMPEVEEESGCCSR